MRNTSFVVHTLWLMLILLCQQSSLAQKSLKKAWTENERQILIDGLTRTRNALLDEVSGLNDLQWRFKESPDRWSIAEVVEHLGLQEDMYFREIYLISQQSPMPDLMDRVKGKEDRILAYAKDPEKGKAAWYLEPLGRWPDKETSIAQFKRSRGKILEFVESTDKDLRAHFTLRDYDDELWSIRDLHQLLLTTISHTDRHIRQIRRIKKHQDFPQ